MVEIKGTHGIITLRVMKEWTGSIGNEWQWSQGEIIDAAASGGELELEVINGKYWIHIVGWNGDEDSSKDFDLTDDSGRYVNSGGACYFYYRFNGGVVDTCSSTTAGGTLTASGGAQNTGSGKMAGGVQFDGSGDYYTGTEGTIDITADWSFEIWFNANDVSSGSIFGIHNGDGTASQS